MTEAGQLLDKDLAYYCQCFSELKVNTTEARGKAPYKPILLLSVIELVAEGIITTNSINTSDEEVFERLRQTFNEYRKTLSFDQLKGVLSLPFYHLKNEKNKFWFLDYFPGYDNKNFEIKEATRKTIDGLKEYVKRAYIDTALLELLKNQYSREKLVNSLIEVWFSLKENKIEDILKIHRNFQNSIEKDIEKLIQAESCREKRAFYLNKVAVRNAFFGKAVVHAYGYKCAFCGLKVTRSITQNIVDGAHIQPFARFYNNSIKNGISLCKNHHWAFDRGWFFIEYIKEDNKYKYKIRVASDIEETSNENARCMLGLENDEIQLPISDKYYPDPDALSWHRNNVFKEKIGV